MNIVRSSLENIFPLWKFPYLLHCYELQSHTKLSTYFDKTIKSILIALDRTRRFFANIIRQLINQKLTAKTAQTCLQDVSIIPLQHFKGHYARIQDRPDLKDGLKGDATWRGSASELRSLWHHANNVAMVWNN